MKHKIKKYDIKKIIKLKNNHLNQNNAIAKTNNLLEIMYWVLSSGTQQVYLF